MNTTGYQEAEMEIEDGEMRYYTMLMQSPFAFSIMKGKDQEITLANDLMKEFWGKGKDVEGKTLLQVLPELADQPFPAMIDQVFTTGVPVHISEILARLKYDGKMEDRYFNITYQPYYEKDKRISGVTTVAYDVTEMVLIRKKTEASEAFNRSILDISPDCIKVLDTEGRLQFMSTNGLCLMEINDFSRYKGQYWWNLWAEQDRPMIRDAIAKALTGEKVQFEALNNTAKGTPQWWDVIILPILADGQTEKIERIFSVSRDITDYKEAILKLEKSEKYFRQLADLMPSKINNADTAGNVFYFNKKWLDYTGLNIEELKDQGYYKIMHPDELEEYQNRFQQASATGTILDMEMRFLNKDGDYKWHLNLASPVKDEHGTITMWVGSTTEIHEQITQKAALQNAVKERTKELEQVNAELVFQNKEKERKSAELRIANRELVFQNEEKEKRSVELINANKELEAFAYVSSHDMQEPLRKIQTFAGRILEKEVENLSRQGKDYFRRMQDAAGRMRQLIQDLLAYSRINSTEHEFEQTDLRHLVEEVKAQLEEVIREKRALIEISETCQVRIIPYQFRQLMYSLVDNALKFSLPDQPPHIQIKFETGEGSHFGHQQLLPEKHYCHITVTDNGIGFQPIYKDKIFEVFQRLHGQDEYAGTGIGLAIVKKIVENHHGIITATSQLNQGATFDIYLPV